jgi:hypothetical protein
MLPSGVQTPPTAILQGKSRFCTKEGDRRAVIRRFPYAVLYEEKDAEIVVYAVFDCRQHPSKWRERLQ